MERHYNNTMYTGIGDVDYDETDASAELELSADELLDQQVRAEHQDWLESVNSEPYEVPNELF